MIKSWIDTDRVLDRCECGGFVKFVCDTVRQPNSWKAHCVDCDNATEWEFSESQVMTAWNRMMRSGRDNKETIMKVLKYRDGGKEFFTRECDRQNRGFEDDGGICGLCERRAVQTGCADVPTEAFKRANCFFSTEFIVLGTRFGVQNRITACPYFQPASGVAVVPAE